MAKKQRTLSRGKPSPKLKDRQGLPDKPASQPSKPTKRKPKRR